MASRPLSTLAPKSFRVLGLQQVAIGGLDKSALKALWQGTRLDTTTPVLATQRRQAALTP